MLFASFPSMRAIALATFLPLAAGFDAAASAAPPPPAVVPPAYRQPVDGYDLQTHYQLWRFWVEQQKGAAADQLLATPDALEGFVPSGRPFLQFSKQGDLGRFVTGEIRSYCRPSKPSAFDAASCHYRLRRVYVPHDAADLDENPVSRWTRDAFDPVKLVERLRALNLGPDTDWWRADKAAMFSTLPSPIPVLVDNATLVRLDSRDCPGFAAALLDLDTRKLSWRTDVRTVGQDTKSVYPGPHSVVPEWALEIVTPAGGSVRIEGTGEDLYAVVGPVLQAADQCEKQGKHRSTTGARSRTSP